MLEITDYGVPDLNLSGMVETSVGARLSIPFADVQVWTRDWSRRMVGLCSHPRSFHRHPQPAALRGSSLRGYRHLQPRTCLLLRSRTALIYMHLAPQEGALMRRL